MQNTPANMIIMPWAFTLEESTIRVDNLHTHITFAILSKNFEFLYSNMGTKERADLVTCLKENKQYLVKE